MSGSVTEHRGAAPASIPCGVVTVSDTRTLATDQGGDLVVARLTQWGHVVARRELVPDEPDRITDVIQQLAQSQVVRAILVTGGTGIRPRDHTYETVRRMLDSDIPGYGELFRMLSYQEIGAAAMLIRADRTGCDCDDARLSSRDPAGHGEASGPRTGAPGP